MSAPKNYKVLTISPKGSGKTTFLASMFYNLSSEMDGFRLDVENYSTANYLKSLYIKLIANKEFPPATKTAKIESFEFKCILRTLENEYNPFNITYYEYGGGRVTDVIDDDDNAFIDAVKNAHILLGMIDGQSLKEALDRNDYNSEFYLSELDHVITLLNNNHPKGRIVQLIISKWDLLQDSYSIEEVKNNLLGFSRFKNFANNVLKRNGKIRFIPISSVGFNFAELDENGNMKIRQNAQLRPYNLTVPLSLVLLDPMQSEIEALEVESEQLEVTQTYTPEVKLTFWEKVTRLGGHALENLSYRHNVEIDFLATMANHWKSAGNSRLESIKAEYIAMQQELQKNVNLVNSEKQAAEHLTKLFYSQLLQLDEKHPGSLIEKL